LTYDLCITSVGYSDNLPRIVYISYRHRQPNIYFFSLEYALFVWISYVVISAVYTTRTTSRYTTRILHSLSQSIATTI